MPKESKLIKLVDRINSDIRKKVLFCSIFIFAVIGIILLVNSQAATTAVGVEPENGNTSGNLMVMNDSTASNGKGTFFGMHMTGGSGSFLFNSTLTYSQIQSVYK